VTSKHAYLSSAGYTTPLPTLPALLTQEEMVARIEAARLETADRTCQTCGAPLGVQHSRICYCCGERKPLTAFAQKHNNKLGREYLCKTCKRARAKVTDAARYARKKRAAFREVLGRPS
jgi:superfamily II helicase